jgi:hypothetical protein
VASAVLEEEALVAVELVEAGSPMVSLFTTLKSEKLIQKYQDTEALEKDSYRPIGRTWQLTYPNGNRSLGRVFGSLHRVL